MERLKKAEADAFAAIGEALTQANDCKQIKKEAMPLISAVLKENREDFIGEGVTIGNYKFKIVVRDELTAIRV